MSKHTPPKRSMAMERLVVTVASSLCLLAGPAVAADYVVVDMATLSQGASAVVRGPNLSGEAIGGGRVLRGAQLAPARQGLLFQPGATVPIAGLGESDFTTGFGVNDAGTMAGTTNADEAIRAFVADRGGPARELAPLPGDAASAAFAISNRGQVAGASSGPVGERAVTWFAGGAVSALAVNGDRSSRALALNDRGDIVGTAGTAQARRAVLWRQGGAAEELPLLPGFSASEAAGVNAQGNVIGYCATADEFRRATVWWAAGGAPLDLGALSGHSSSQAHGMNEQGDVVGASWSGEQSRAFIWSPAAGMRDLNSLIEAPGIVLTKAVGINNAGTIAVLGRDAVDGEGHGHDHAHGDGHDHEAPIRVFLLRRIGG